MFFFRRRCPETPRSRRPRLGAWTGGLCLAGLAAGMTAWACGPEFKQMLLDRGAALKSVIVSDFDSEAAALVKPTGKPLPSNGGAVVDAESNRKQRESAEAAGLGAADAAKLHAMRAAPDGDQAYALGAGLPEGLRLYTAAAVDFALSPGACSRELPGRMAEPPDDTAEAEAPAASDAGATAGETAASSASAPLAALPASAPASAASAPGEGASAAQASANAAPPEAVFERMARRMRAVLALPDKDRRSRAAWAAYSLGRAHAEHCRRAAALPWFQATRQLVRDGAADPLFLAEASLGEEARAQWTDGQVGPAIALYAEQAARGSLSGRNSLSELAAYLLGHPDKLQPWLHDPLVQKLVVRYALSLADSAGLEARSAAARTTAPPGSALSLGAGVGRLLDLLSRRDTAQVEQADALAALAYALGRDAQARQLAQRSRSALSEWVQAKLALRAGRLQAAAAHYAAAIRMVQQHEGPALPAGFSFVTEEGPGGTLEQTLRSEQGFLSLARGDFVQALAQLYAVGQVYWLDLAYLAERVLTADELKAFVDAHVPEPPLPRLERQGKEEVAVPEPGSLLPARNAAAQLRDLLARRLMREGRAAEAYAYFPAPGDKRFADPRVREHARDYSAALARARDAWTAIGRAEAAFEAATLVRRHGMELLGYELGPDGNASSGGYEMATPEALPAALATREEGQRRKASAPKEDIRYHYRLEAARLAVQAADGLPPRSQAYAASLCWGTHWLDGVGRTEAAQALYRRYVREGALLPWATPFGQHCPQPEFNRARWLEIRQQARLLRLQARPYKAWIYAATGVALTMLAAFARLLWLRRRKRQAVR